MAQVPSLSLSLEAEIRRRTFDDIAALESCSAPLYRIEVRGTRPLQTYIIHKHHDSLSRLVDAARNRLPDLLRFIQTRQEKWVSVPLRPYDAGKAWIIEELVPEPPGTGTEGPFPWVNRDTNPLDATLGDGAYWILGLTLGREYQPFAGVVGMHLNMPSQNPDMPVFLAARWNLSAKVLEALWEREIVKPTWAAYDVHATLRLLKANPKRAYRAILARIEQDVHDYSTAKRFHFQRVNDLSDIHPLELVGYPLPYSIMKAYEGYLNTWLNRGSMKPTEEWLSMSMLRVLHTVKPKLVLYFAKWRAKWSPDNKVSYTEMVQIINDRSSRDE